MNPRKRKRPVDTQPAFRKWLLKQPCVVPGCKGRPDAHHHTGRRGLGQKADDKHRMPVCRRHHDELHTFTGFFYGWNKNRRRAFQSQHCDEHWARFLLEAPPEVETTEDVF